MRALDTNVLVRFLVQDDDKQVAIVDQLFSEAEKNKESLYLTSLVVLELMWVLKASYKVERGDILTAVGELLNMPVLKFQDQSALRSFVVEAADNNFDLSDLLIGQIAQAAACENTLTFDKKAAKSDYFKMLALQS